MRGSSPHPEGGRHFGASSGVRRDAAAASAVTRLSSPWAEEGCAAPTGRAAPPAGIVVQTRSVRVASPGDGLSSMAGEDGGVMNLTQGDTLLSPRRAAFRLASSLRPRWPREGKGRKRLGVSHLPS